MLRLSERLRAVAGLIGDGHVLADVGTDHGYVPIYLCQQRRIPRAIAMDIGRGPLERAKEHIQLNGLQDYIETRLSDGVEKLLPGEADTILMAGMGGGLVMHILEAGQEVCREAAELVLQPQSELYRVRGYLAGHGYMVDAEEMVEEDGKYYPMMRVHWVGQPENACAPTDLTSMRERVADDTAAGDLLRRDVGLLYGEGLLSVGHPVLYAYLKREQKILGQIAGELAAQPQTEQIVRRRQEIEHALACNEMARGYYINI